MGIELFFWPVHWVHVAPWHALVIGVFLSVYCALVRLALGRMDARFFDISSIVTIVLWIILWPYELCMQEWATKAIRIDMLLIGVVLNIVTIICILSSLESLFLKMKLTYYDRD